jgi:hypothetical protein
LPIHNIYASLSLFFICNPALVISEWFSNLIIGRRFSILIFLKVLHYDSFYNGSRLTFLVVLIPPMLTNKKRVRGNWNSKLNYTGWKWRITFIPFAIVHSIKYSACMRLNQALEKVRWVWGYKIKLLLHLWLSLLSQRDLTNYFWNQNIGLWDREGDWLISIFHHAIGRVWVFVFLFVI